RLVRLTRRQQGADQAGLYRRILGRHLGNLREDRSSPFAVAFGEDLLTHGNQLRDVGLLLGVASLDRKALQQLIQHLLELRFGSRRRQIGDRLALEDRVDSRNRADLKLRRNELDRKSTRLNSSHVKISYAVFCLKK